MDHLERAVRDGLRVAVTRRGNEHIVIAKRLTTVGTRDAWRRTEEVVIGEAQNRRAKANAEAEGEYHT